MVSSVIGNGDAADLRCIYRHKGKASVGGEGCVAVSVFLLNIDQLGWGGFLIRIAILLAVFAVLGYAIYATERFLKRKTVKAKT